MSISRLETLIHNIKDDIPGGDYLKIMNTFKDVYEEYCDKDGEVPDQELYQEEDHDIIELSERDKKIINGRLYYVKWDNDVNNKLVFSYPKPNQTIGVLIDNEIYPIEWI